MVVAAADVSGAVATVDTDDGDAEWWDLSITMGTISSLPPPGARYASRWPLLRAVTTSSKIPAATSPRCLL